MSAQAEEVVASAASLAQMAQELESLVARFRLDATGNGASDFPGRQVSESGPVNLRSRRAA